MGPTGLTPCAVAARALEAALDSVVFQQGRVEVAARPDPVPGPHEVVVRTHAAGINGADLLQLAGHYPAPTGTPDDQPGLELAGEVAQLGSGVTRWAVGDRVMGIVSGAGQAELVALHEDLAMPVPDGLDMVAAGGMPEALVTAHDALVTQGGLAAGDRVLVTGAAGGVGSIAVQLAAGLGATVIASARGTHRSSVLAELGAHQVVTPSDQASAGPYDVVLELVGAPSLATTTRALATGARVVVIGVGAGPRLELNLLHLMQARAVLRGSTLRARPLADRIVASRRAARLAVHLVGSGALVVPVHAQFRFREAAAGYEAFQTPGTVGKVVLVPDGDAPA